jgi:hypothetical protein
MNEIENDDTAGDKVPEPKTLAFTRLGGDYYLGDQFPHLIGTMATKDDILAQLVVTAYKSNRTLKNAGLHVFGPFGSEEEAQRFFTKVINHPDWEPGEVPALNPPEVFGTGNERL